MTTREERQQNRRELGRYYYRMCKIIMRFGGRISEMSTEYQKQRLREIIEKDYTEVFKIANIGPKAVKAICEWCGAKEPQIQEPRKKGYSQKWIDMAILVLEKNGYKVSKIAGRKQQ